MSSLAELLESLPPDADYSKIEVVFHDDVTEYAYGVRCTGTGPDHLAITWDVEKCYYTPHNGKQLKEM